ncbi:MAG: DUF815 domain-containing protein [Candidatus Gastranaerophilales bacterium]|nr:DUF815 domain-containing protein [Candidatus Gastranaerophilales bacterium]
MMDNLEKIYLSSYFLYVFGDLKNDSIFKKFLELIKTVEKEENIEKNIESYINFVSSLKKQKETNFSSYIQRNIFKTEIGEDKEQIEKELKIISQFSKINFQFLKEKLSEKFPQYVDLFENLPKFDSFEFDLCLNDFKAQEQEEDELYKNHQAFIFDNDFEIKPVKTSENISFASLKGYSEQKRVLYDNTSALLSGARVNNILLYGDAGCGKSSSVRALLNEFKDIKIIQILKNNLINLDKLYLKLENLPYKFIIFADDISFDESDEIFSTMKAIIEGSLIQCPDNAVIYATSNRRHLVKETLSSRYGDEIHLKDTLNEINSLSERFGINLFFSKPTNDEFNQIVLELARDNNIKIDEKTLIEKAQRLALIKGTRSPRIAKQLIDNLVAHIDI